MYPARTEIVTCVQDKPLQTKSSQITFTTKRTNCPPATINNIQISVQKRSKISWLISGPKTNLAEAHQDKTPATQPKCHGS
jgi:hypothetical protein